MNGIFIRKYNNFNILNKNNLEAINYFGAIIILLFISFSAIAKSFKVEVMAYVLLLVLGSINLFFKKFLNNCIKFFEWNSYKVLKENLYGVYSSSARELHPKIVLDISKENILFGNSELTKNLRKRYVTKLSLNNKIARYFLVNNKEYYIFSNGISYILVRYEIIVFFLYFYLYFQKSIKQINLEKILYILTIIFIFSVQGANLLPYFMILIYTTYINKKSTKIQS